MTHQRKPWYRIRNIFLALLFIALAFCVWLVIEVRQIATAKPNIATNYRAQFTALSAQSAGLPADHDGSASWELFLAMIKLADEIEKQHKVDVYSGSIQPRDHTDTGIVEFDRVAEWRIIPTDIDRERRALAAMHERGVFELLRQFRSMPLALRPPNADVSFIEELMPELASSRRFAKMLAASMRIEADAGNLDTGIERFESMLQVAHTISHQYSIIAALVSRSIETIALSQMRHLLMERELMNSQLEQIARAMDRFACAPMQLGLVGEQLLFHDFVQRTYSDNRVGDGYVLPHAVEAMGGLGGSTDKIPNVLALLASRFYLARRGETLAVFDSYMDQMIAESRKAAVDRWKAGNPDYIVDTLSSRHMILKLLMPALRKAVGNEDNFAMFRTGTRLMLALAAYRLAHSEWPESLEALVPEFLAELPVDPVNGKPFGYKQLIDDPHGREYLLYGFGLNGVDDGGAEAGLRQQYEALSDSRVTGVDFILNQPRPERSD